MVGSGPAGLAFARVLHRHGHPVTVLERDTAPDARSQGGTLDLHEGLGQRALDKAGLLAEFRALSRPEGQAMRILDPDGTVLRDWRPRPDDRANPEIDRGQLRDLLLGPLDVQWGREVTQVVPGNGDGVRVRCADGRQETFDLVVGADGAWSRVRPAVSQVSPRYTGVTMVETSLDDVDTAHPDLARLVGDGSPGRVRREPRSRCPAQQRRPPQGLRAVPRTAGPAGDGGPGRRRDRAIGSVGPLRRLGRSGPRPPPPRHRFRPAPAPRPARLPHLAPCPRGDPAGRRRPSDAPAGAGANLALLEGAELAEAVAAGPADPDDAVRAFEERMWARAGRWAQLTTAGLERLVSADPAEALALFDQVQPS